MGRAKSEKVVLETYDVIRFFNDCLARYHSADDWGVDEMQTKPRNGRKRRGISSSTIVPEKVKYPTQSCVATASGSGFMLTADSEECEQKSKNGFCVQERVATALEIMAGNNHIKEEVDPMNANVPEFFSDVLDALLEWSGNVIIWPGEGERERIHKSFFEKTGVDGIVGCVDGTVVDLADSADASNSNSPNAINVSLVTDDQMKIRWVFAKYRTNVDDNSVFKQSLLCEQLKDGTKQGILIGDDAYDDEPFLLTPSGESDKLREAHLITQATVESWKRQFPILFSYMRPSKAARIIVGSAALYNLTRLEGEPLFTADEEKPKIFRRRKTDQRKDKS
ncbi:hypothetical protein TELCIR_06854 [Teladorsagia circumcincta]|uniref:DDE Tnp4 domain-containing protein n=1 Tax=Teladorsagia circumcincta TaxID=45464 RepID=A0A2G9UP59_TELCI|nr:hypothetical protein TELCIR_06854 [Teladorsagia circumcincta]